MAKPACLVVKGSSLEKGNGEVLIFCDGFGQALKKLHTIAENHDSYINVFVHLHMFSVRYSLYSTCPHSFTLNI